MIVGRNPNSLDEAGVSRAAIESLAENFSDGIVAPAFWLGLGGLTGAALYKATNTADSMIGHRTPRHEAFGWAAARFDDLINIPASRLTALLLVVAALLIPKMDGRAACRAIACTWHCSAPQRSPAAPSPWSACSRSRPEPIDSCARPRVAQHDRRAGVRAARTSLPVGVPGARSRTFRSREHGSPAGRGGVRAGLDPGSCRTHSGRVRSGSSGDLCSLRG